MDAFLPARKREQEMEPMKGVEKFKKVWQKCQLRNLPRGRSHTELGIKGKNLREDERGDNYKLREFSNRGDNNRHLAEPRES